ncbi:hypothetical protein BSL82_03650 [Tardibacter chloracetimidivorans]|uniref:Uncharacterized protein n=1 Tax=Tardibacter chloracetimidivorans TaxID=1921510 RepID=A0A1L3ZS97_9SPHN|nr:hypothetical protein [Tardibacter chloracetimidivorans]API58511.1 hypothetical protein BSL82_03650 [Tardibacter chloracetimidivorans]
MITDQTPWHILGDIRESLGRLEGKFDAQRERNEKTDANLADHGDRITALETDQDRMKTRFNLLAWIGSVLLALLTVFGDRILNLLF